MEYLELLKIFRPYYGKNQKYYNEIHPILYYNDEFYKNPFLNNDNNVKEEKENINENQIQKVLTDYKIGYHRDDFLKLLVLIIRERRPDLNYYNLIDQIIMDYDTLNLYREYNFRDYKISKVDLRNLILNKNFNNLFFIQFCADYFSFIITVISNNEIKVCYPRNDSSILAPKIFIYNLYDERFYHLQVNSKYWLLHNEYKEQKIKQDVDIKEMKLEEVKKVEEIKEVEEEEPKYDCKELMKLKLTELQDIAKEMNIEIDKLNTSKTKMIKKKKEELIAEIIKN